MKLSSLRRLRRNTITVTGIGVIVAAAVGVLPADAAVPFASAAFSGSASGAAVHLDLGDGSANVDVAPASAAVNSKGLTAATSEMGGVVSPAQASKNSYARGAGLDLLGSQVAGLAEAAAAPTASDIKELGPIAIDPIAYASLVRGTAAAKWNPETCLLGEDISRGLGYAANAQLVDTGGDTGDDLDAPLAEVESDDPTRDVVQTIARQTMVPNADGTFGLRSTVSQTLAPVTIAGALTIEVLGEWSLSVTATGQSGSTVANRVSYLPTKTDTGQPVGPLTPVIRIIQPGTPGNPDITTVLALQDILGDTGLSIPVPGLAEITIGENPRAIGGDADSNPQVAADGTSASAAVDVVRVTLLDGSLADIRVGHMEVKAAAPAGGVTCPIPTSKKATPSIVNATTAPDGKFQVAITIKNSFACDLINVSATDEIIRKTGNVAFKIVEDDSRNDPKKGAGATFKTNSTTSATATYANLGTIPVGGSKVLNLVIQVTGGGGEIQDTATAKGTLNCGPNSAIGQATVNLAGNFTLITTVARVLARTGGEATLALLFSGVAVTGAAVRRITRRRRSA